MAAPKQRWMRDALVAAVLIAAAFAALWLRGSSAQESDGLARGAKGSAASLDVPRSPVVVPGRRVVYRKGAKPHSDRPDAALRVASAEELEENEKVDAEQLELLELLEKEDAEWQELAKEEIEGLQGYALLIPPEDADSFRHIVDKLAWTSALGLHRPEDLEGDFFNRVFFSAGAWGKNPEFRRAWVYLLRAAGVELDAVVEREVVRLTAELFERGYGEVREIERALFGAPLEGGDPNYWLERGYPSLDLCAEVWALRADACSFLYVEYLERLASLMSEENYEVLAQFLALFNLSS